MEFELNEYLFWKVLPWVFILALALAVLFVLNNSAFPLGGR